MFIFNSHDKFDRFDRQIIVLNQIIQIESWRKCRCCAWVWKRVCHHQCLNLQPRAWHRALMVRAECDTTQLFRCPLQYICFVDSVNLGRCTFLQKSFITLTTDSNYDLDIGNFCIAKIYRTSRWLGFKIIFDKNHSRDREHGMLI